MLMVMVMMMMKNAHVLLTARLFLLFIYFDLALFALSFVCCLPSSFHVFICHDRTGPVAMFLFGLFGFGLRICA